MIPGALCEIGIWLSLTHFSQIPKVGLYAGLCRRRWLAQTNGDGGDNGADLWTKKNSWLGHCYRRVNYTTRYTMRLEIRPDGNAFLHLVPWAGLISVTADITATASTLLASAVRVWVDGRCTRWGRREVHAVVLIEGGRGPIIITGKTRWARRDAHIAVFIGGGCGLIVIFGRWCGFAVVGTRRESPFVIFSRRSHVRPRA